MSVEHRQDAEVRAGGVEGDLIAEAAVWLSVDAMRLQLLDRDMLSVRTGRRPHAGVGGAGDLADDREPLETPRLDHAVRVTRSPDAL